MVKYLVALLDSLCDMILITTKEFIQSLLKFYCREENQSLERLSGGA